MTISSQISTPTLAVCRWEAGTTCPRGLYHVQMKSHEDQRYIQLQGKGDINGEFELKTGRARLT